MQDFLQDLRFSLRMLARAPGFTTVVVIAMALGIGVNTMIFSIVSGVLLRELPFPHPERLMLVESTDRSTGHDDLGVSFPDFLDQSARSRSFEGLGAYYTGQALVTLDREPERLRDAIVTASLFPTLDVHPLLGRSFTRDEEVLGKNWSSVIISHRIWSQRFAGDPHVIGRVFRMNSRMRTIVGVMPPGFRFPEISDFWIPLAFDPSEDRRQERTLAVVARLKPGFATATGQAELSTLAGALEHEYPASNRGIGFAMEQLQHRWVRDVRPFMVLLMAAVSFVLLIACANVANLMLARAAVRQREVSLRLALGASRGRIVRQLLTESILVSLIGGGLGVLVALWGNDIMLASIPIELPYFLHFDVDGGVLIFTVLVSIFSGVLFGMAPALQATRTGLHEALKEGGAQSSAGRGRNRTRNMLVVAEVALALVLLAGAGLMVRSFLHMQEVRSGLKPDGVLTGTITLPVAVYPGEAERRGFFRELLAQIATLPGVRSAAAVSNLPLGNESWTDRVVAEGARDPDPAHGVEVYFSVVAPGYFRTVGIPLFGGRDLTPQDREDGPPVVVISRSAANRLWPNQNPIGRRLRYGMARDSVVWRTVVGMVGNVRQIARNDRLTAAEVFIPHPQNPVQTMNLVVRGDGSPGALLTAIRRLVQARDPSLPLYDARTLRESIQLAVWEPRLYATLMGAFGLLALVIAVMGIYGVMAYSVAQRTQEIGIRMALGAERSTVLGMVVGQAMRLTVIGLGIGLGAAYGVTRLMASLLFGVSTSDPPTYLGVTLILASSALLASWLPAHRAASVNPIVALRYE